MVRFIKDILDKIKMWWKLGIVKCRSSVQNHEGHNVIFRDLGSMYIYFTAELIRDEKENFDWFPWRFASKQYQQLL